jgi:hypothetical protein
MHLCRTDDWTMLMPRTRNHHDERVPHDIMLGGESAGVSWTSALHTAQSPGLDGIPYFVQAGGGHAAARLKASGGVPNCRRNVRVKWLWSQKPLTTAISASERVDCVSRSRACSSRCPIK